MTGEEWVFIRPRDLCGHAVRDSDGREVGVVEAVVRRDDDELELLIAERHHRRRATRVAFDAVQIDRTGDLWMRPAVSVLRFRTRAPEEVA